ncbi:hypothetical protein FB451DRAFT_1385125 [Mycena latifolia]|nr:hypothetical protein FB451DRAFT_1385125 [Mycena latifolia]
MFLRAPVVFGTMFLAQTVAGVPGSARRVQALRPRNNINIPASCQAGCEVFTPFLAGASCPVTECCSMIFQTGYFECFKCVGVAINATDFSIAQEYVDVLTTSCIAEGIALPELTLPGQNSARTLATALPAGASSIPIFASGVPAAPSGSVVRHSTVVSTPPAPSRSAPTGTKTAAHSATTVSHSGASQISGSGSGPSQSAGLGSGLSQSAGSGSAAISGSPTVSGAASGSQSSTTAPPQSTVTSPPTSSSASAPGPTTSAPSNAAFRPRSGSDVVAGLFALIALQALLA